MNPADLPDEALFEEALNCDSPEELAAWLDEHCAGQPELRQRIEALLEAHSGPGMSVNTVRIDLGPEEEEVTGTVIGRYKILQKIAEGGMGGVYMAEQLEPVRRKVALKIIKLGMDTKAVIARFEAERQALAMMDHPNIAKVLDAGATEMGRPFFVMELVQGVPITEYCDRNKLPTEERLKLFVAVCQAIQHAHQKGIIHRDIKPSNVMVTLHDGVPVPKIIDFGVAKATNQRLTEKTLFTNYAQMIGTPAYMSPEQAEMSGLDIDTRSDIYSLGVLLYELLTGAPPFDPKELLSKGYGEIQRFIAQEEPPRPSTLVSTMHADRRTTIARNRSIEPETLDRTLRRDLDWIVMKCLEKDRTRRYDTANGLAMDVQRYLATEPVLARPPSKLYELQKSVRRHKVGYAAAAAVVLALAIGVVVSSWQAVRATRAEERVRDTLVDVRKERDRATEAEEKAKSETALTMAANQQKETALELARKNEAIERRRFYAAQMSLAAQSWRSGQLGRAVSLLETLRPALSETDLRGWEWYYLYEKCRPNVVNYWRAHSDCVVKMVWSPDGAWFASAGGDRTLRIWDGHTGELRETLSWNAGWLWGLAISKDGRFLVGGNSTGEVIVWDMVSRREIRRWMAHLVSDGTPLIAISPDCSRIATASAPMNWVALWDFEGRKIAEIRADSILVGKLEFSPDGKLIGQLGVDRFVFDEDGPKLRVGSPVVNTRARKPTVDKAQAYSEEIPGKNAFLMSSDRSLWLEDIDSKARAWRGTELAQIRSAAIDPSGRFLAVGDNDGWITLRDLGSAATPADSSRDSIWKPAPGENKFLWSIAYSTDGRQLLAGVDQLTTLDAKTLAEEKAGPQGVIKDISASANLVAAVRDGRVFICDAQTGAVRSTFGLEINSWVELTHLSVCISPNGRLVATTTSWKDSFIELWDAQSGRHLARLPCEHLTVASMAFSPDSKYLAAGNQFIRVSVYDVSTGELVDSERVGGQIETVSAVAYSPDGSLLAAAANGGHLALFDVDRVSGKLKLRTWLDGHTGWINALGFSPDGKTMVSATEDQTIFWDVDLGQARMSLDVGLWRPVFSPSGRELACITSGDSVTVMKIADQPFASARKTWRSRWDADSPGELSGAALEEAAEGRDGEAQARLRKAIEAWKSAGDGVTLGDQLECLVNFEFALSAVSDLRGDTAAADRHYKSALELADRFAGLFPQGAESSRRRATLIRDGLGKLGYALGSAGHWKSAAASYQRAAEAQPERSVYWYLLAVARLRQGDLPGYREACAGLVQNCGGIDEAESYSWLAWAPALGEGALADYSMPIAFARRLARSDSDDIVDQTALGALLYRAGNYAEAATELRAAEQHFLSKPREERNAVYPRLFLAMAEWRLGHADEARAIWAKSQDGLRTELNSSTRWQYRAPLETLREEAAALLQVPDAKQDAANL